MASQNIEQFSDRELMDEVRRGNKSYFSELVKRNQQSLVNFFRRSGVGTDAEDLAQDTFVRVYRYRDRYVPSAKFTTFLYMIARQVRIDWLRRRGRRWGLLERVKDDPSVHWGKVASPHKRAAGLDAAALLDTLPGAMREVVVMSLYQGLPYAEISELLGIPEGTVKSRMYNALRRMRKALEQDENEN